MPMLRRRLALTLHAATLCALMLSCVINTQAAAPANSVKLASKSLFTVRASSASILCGNLPPWSPGRMVSDRFYPTRVEIKALKAKISKSSGSARRALEAKVRQLNSYLSKGKAPCAKGPPRAVSTPTPSGPFDALGNVTAAGKVAFGIPSNLSASVNSGIGAWNSTCNGCHHMQPSGLGIRSFPEIKARIQLSPMLFSIPGELTEQQIADIVAFANY